ncbi:MAG TPA: hypothetical protein VID95_07360 [Candidatus Limnocylindrales bacterium]
MTTNRPPEGLCATCRHARPVVSARGSQFTLCERSRTDPAYPRYPRLPVLACRGFEPGRPDADPADDRP